MRAKHAEFHLLVSSTVPNKVEALRICSGRDDLKNPWRYAGFLRPPEIVRGSGGKTSPSINRSWDRDVPFLKRRSYFDGWSFIGMTDCRLLRELVYLFVGARGFTRPDELELASPQALFCRPFADQVFGYHNEEVTPILQVTSHFAGQPAKARLTK